MDAGAKLIQNFKGRLGDDYYLIIEDIFYAALECQQFDTATLMLTKLKDRFENAPRVVKLHGIYQEAVGEEDGAEKIYDHLLSENPLNIDAHKRKIALLRTADRVPEAINELNKLLEENMCDKEAWLELADIYLEKLNYQRALFCYEQVCLLSPKNMHYFVKCAEILYTIGGTANLTLARNYYSFALYFDENNLPGILGLIRTCKALEAAKKSDAKNKDLLALGTKALKKIYEKKNPALLATLPV